MGDLAEGWKEQSKVWAPLATGLKNTWRDAEQDGKRARQSVRRSAERLAACTEHRKLSSPPPAPALLTVLRTITALCGIRHMLLADAVLVCLSVSARAGADSGLEAPAAEYLPTGSRRGHAASQKRELEETGNCWELLCVSYSLVSRVTMMRIGRLFIPPTQLELHIKLYSIVVNSVPTWERRGQRWVSDITAWKQAGTRKLKTTISAMIWELPFYDWRTWHREKPGSTKNETAVSALVALWVECLRIRGHICFVKQKHTCQSSTKDLLKHVHDRET